MPKVAIIAALHREVRSLTRGASVSAKLLQQGIHLYELPDVVIVAAGMGRERAALAVEAAMGRGAVSLLLSVGLAGSCSPAFAAGAVMEATELVDARTGERFRTDAASMPPAVLVTAESIATVAEKVRLHAAYTAAAVDMEATTVARLARAHGLPFRAVKGISDAHDFELASLARFAGPRGEFRTAAFAVHTALRPRQWAKTLRLGKVSQRALVNLDARLRAILREQGLRVAAPSA